MKNISEVIEPNDIDLQIFELLKGKFDLFKLQELGVIEIASNEIVNFYILRFEDQVKIYEVFPDKKKNKVIRINIFDISKLIKILNVSGLIDLQEIDILVFAIVYSDSIDILYKDTYTGSYLRFRFIDFKNIEFRVAIKEVIFIYFDKDKNIIIYAINSENKKMSLTLSSNGSYTEVTFSYDNIGFEEVFKEAKDNESIIELSNIAL